MKVKVTYEKKTFHTAEVKVDDAALLKYVQRGGSDAASLEELLADDGEDVEYLLREFLEEEVFVPGDQLLGIPVSPAGPAEYLIDTVEQL